MARMSDLDQALNQAIEQYRRSHPASERLHQQALGVLPGGNTRSVLFFDPFPPYMVRGEGCHLWDADGHRYLDALGEYTAGLYGHSDPAIRAAVSEALHSGLSLSSHTEREGLLARELQRRFPSMELLRFTNSGTEANLMALATATAVTERRKVLVFKGAYHGGVLAFGQGGSPVNVPYEWVVARYNDLEDVRAQVAAHGKDLAAILVEPMLGSGGCIPGEPHFLQGLRALADEKGALLILDEVMTSRLSFGGRQSQLGIRPDLTTLGKYFGGGLSFGAFGGRADLMARYDPRRPQAWQHAGTFNNNVLTMAAGLAGLKHLLTAERLDALNRRGDALRTKLNKMLEAQGVPLQLTGLGSLMQLHPLAGPLRSADDLVAADDRVKALMFFELLGRSVYMARRGFIALSLPFGDAECMRLEHAMGEAVNARRGLWPPAAPAPALQRPAGA
ncbi:aspartate aminotransferase family protein [Ottowia oryzae]|uniref:Aspartate aminotransferase family protein n=2 Tax=Ottowia oryzae TaxID=2109914 RepID=A0A2S0MED1_9BURK|nr:aspartate aminotransferase family protein [Ottowia oryzae]